MTNPERYSTWQKIAAGAYLAAFAAGVVTLGAVLTGKFPPKQDRGRE